MARNVQVVTFPDVPLAQSQEAAPLAPAAGDAALPSSIRAVVAREVYLGRLRTLHTDAHHLAVLVSGMKVRPIPTDPAAFDALVDTADAIMYTVTSLTR